MTLTKSQERAVEELCERFPGEEGDVIAEHDDAVEFRIADVTFRIATRGKVTELPQDSPGDKSEPGMGEEAGGQTESVPAPPPIPMVDSLPEVRRPEVFEAMTLADERQVAAELEGRATKTMVYGFKTGGQQVFGLSWIGVREAIRQMNARTSAEIRIDNSRPPVFEDTTVLAEVGWDQDENTAVKEEVPAIRVSVYALDVQHGTGFWGTATVPRDQISKKKRDRLGRYMTNPDGFAANKALSKAQRNALEGHLPRELVEEIINLYRGTEAVEYIEGRSTQIDAPPALTDDRAKAAGDRARELYAELKRISGAKTLTPGRFHQLFTAVQHDHDRLDDFVAYMEETVEQAKGDE